jgi:tetratricopeptide (TPR) repeat protein
MEPSVTFDADDDADRAELHVRRALELEPQLTSRALVSLSRYGVPPENWSEIVPPARDARRGMVAALSIGGHRAQALVELRALLEDEPNPRFQAQAASWALQWGDPALALDAVQKWKAHGGEGPEPHLPALYETQARLRLGQSDAAYESFRQALEALGPRSSSGLKLLCGAGEEYVRHDRLVLAQSIFMEALSYSPSYVCALLGSARVHRRQGDRSSAADYYERVLELEPDHEAAQSELLRLMAAR